MDRFPGRVFKAINRKEHVVKLSVRSVVQVVSLVCLGLAASVAAAQAQGMTPMFGGPADASPPQLQNNRQYGAVVQQQQMQSYVSSMMSASTRTSATGGGFAMRGGGSGGGIAGVANTSMLTQSNPVLMGGMGGGNRLMASQGGMGGQGAMSAEGAAAAAQMQTAQASAAAQTQDGDDGEGGGAPSSMQANPAFVQRDGRMPPGVMLRAQQDPACVDYGR